MHRRRGTPDAIITFPECDVGRMTMRCCWLIVLSVLLLVFPVEAEDGFRKAWRFDLEGIGAFAASPSGRVALSSSGRVVSLSKGGGTEWEWVAEDDITHLAFDTIGNLYVAHSGKLVKLDASGAVQWREDTYGGVYSLDVLPDGRPVLGYDKGVLCFGEDGKKAWEHYAQEECDT